MDDVPPGPTAPEPRRLALSVVIPVHNGGHDFERCLRRLRDSVGADFDFELIVVDDGSTDGSADVARAFGARVLCNGGTKGPASARNEGAKAATTELVFFLDADVAVHPNTLARAVARFDADPSRVALFGSYDDEPPAPGVVSRFRNLLHHFVHQQGHFEDDVRPARTFWTGCGAIRRQDFLDAGGFDPQLYTRPAIEDIEFGYRLTRRGAKILLARDVLGTHLKRWTFGLMVKTDIFQRGVPWMLLIKRQHVDETDLNVRPEQRLCVMASGLAALAALGAWWLPWLLAATACGPLAVVALNAPFYQFLLRKRGLGFAVASVPLHLVYYGCCGLSVLIALTFWHIAPGPSTTEAAPLLATTRRRDPAEVAGRPANRPTTRRPNRWTRR
jgi:glycosyltransferase involved in cell wall biosynthesis